MSSFRFNFSGKLCQQPDENNQEIKWLECEEVLPNKQIIEIEEIVTRAVFTCPKQVEIEHVIVNKALLAITENGSENPTTLAEQNHSDLVTGKYEGGLKIWQCTYDLVHYLDKNQINFNNLNVLDLGCGAGILGIYAFMKGSQVTFQDYNKEILEYVTIPNVYLNIEDNVQRQTEIARCKFYSGDWSAFNKKLGENDVYDVILTSETIYNPNNYDKIIEILSRRLSKNGVAYVAAKVHYFGVGGGVRQFVSKINIHGLLTSKVCWVSQVGIVREILEIKHKM